MLEFPSKSKFGRMIPKENFYKALKLTAEQKECFVSDIKKITWEYKLSSDTINLSSDSAVKEIQVLRVELKKEAVDLKLLESISKANANEIVYLLCYDGLVSVAVYMKKMYCTDWKLEEDVDLTIQGMDLSRVWDSFVEQVALTVESEKNDALSTKKKLAKQEEQEKLRKEIAILEKKMYKTKQFNQQVEMKKKIAEFKTKLDK